MAGARKVAGQGGRTGRHGRLRVVREPLVESATNTREEESAAGRNPSNNEGYQLDPTVHAAIAQDVAAAVKNLQPEWSTRSHARTAEKAGDEDKKVDDWDGALSEIQSVIVDERKRARGGCNYKSFKGCDPPKLTGLGDAIATLQRITAMDKTGHMTWDILKLEEAEKDVEPSRPKTRAYMLTQEQAKQIPDVVTFEEALGKTAPDIIIEPRHSGLATLIIQRAVNGETWSGQFPVRTKYGEKFPVITTLAPCRDHNGTTFGVTCVCADTRQFRRSRLVGSPHRINSHHQPLQSAIVSKISNLFSSQMFHLEKLIIMLLPIASEVKTKMKTTNTDHEGKENKPALHKVLSLKAEAETWMGKKGISWPWKGNHNKINKDTSSSGINNNDQKPELVPQTSCCEITEDPGSSWSNSSSDSIDLHIENLDVEISWDDFIIREKIGQGSHGSGTVYRALLHGSDVAVKIFTKEDYPNDVILAFRKEVCLMKRLRHPNILLFMGAVISPQCLCIVTEFLPRGSLFKLLQRKTTKLDWRRRVLMAMDIARGMNYVHNCQPPIVHRNLKSSNLLADKNWALKVGLSWIKHETYLATNTGTGTPHWMAPEILRDEHVDEKSDVYSYGVVLWEIATEKIPWENLNMMQVVRAVGFENERLEISSDVDPQWASLIQSCWSSEPRSRPTFQEILVKLNDLQKKFSRASVAAKKAS
ncbi:uncharacterized protein LOC143635556 [Bidens hawaiensis]|uniref:uncharacterized protein LOC143635556 n=1 Tax=Bidens hawaiensis TaxID=980011 RepID=UPI00404A776B